MKFDYAGSQFQLQFERKFRNVTLTRRTEPKVVVRDVKRSKYPFTTVTLLSLNPLGTAPTTVATATVGCFPNDKFSNEEGRIQALRKLTKSIQSKDLRARIWEIYLERK